MYRPEWSIEAGADDITRSAIEMRYAHGPNVRSSRSPQVTRARGSLSLSNHDDYWTDARLDALDTIRLKADAAAVVTCKADDWRRQDRKRVAVSLKSSADYDEQISFNASADLNETALLSAAGVTITPIQAWQGWQVDEGQSWCGSLYAFLRKFGLHSNTMVLEDGAGGFKALAPQFDARTTGTRIQFETSHIHQRGLETLRHLGWRRQGQEYRGLDKTEYFYASADFGGTHGDRRVSAISGMSAKLENSNYDLVVEFSNESRWESNNQPAWAVDRIWKLELVTDTSIADPWPFLSNGIAGPLMSASGSNEKAAVTLTRPDGEKWPSNAPSTLTMRGLVRIGLYLTRAGEFTASDFSSTAVTDPANWLADMPWAAGSNAASKFAAKVAWWAGITPRTVRLRFDEFQPSQAAWDAVRGLELGDNAHLSFHEVNFNVNAWASPVRREWHYRAAGVSSVIVDFLSYRDAPAVVPPRYITIGGKFLTIGSKRVQVVAA